MARSNTEELEKEPGKEGTLESFGEKMELWHLYSWWRVGVLYFHTLFGPKILFAEVTVLINLDNIIFVEAKFVHLVCLH